MLFYACRKAALRGVVRLEEGATGLKALTPLIAILAAAALSACASAPINLNASGGDAITPAQTELRQTSAELVSAAEAQGWTLERDGAGLGARVLNRLLTGGSDEDEVDDGLTRYLSVTAPDDAAAGEAVAAVAVDVRRAAELAAELSHDAEAVATADAIADARALAADIAAAERALAALRRADALFVEAAGALEARYSQDAAAPLRSAIARLEEARTRLTEATDALARRRWSMVNASVS